MAPTAISKSDLKSASFQSSLDALPCISIDGAEHEVEALRQNSACRSLIARILGHTEQHLSLAELRVLVQTHRQAPDTWELPEHLATCPLCLELFEALEDEGPPLRQQVLRRYQRLLTQPISAIEAHRTTVTWRYPLAIAAGLAIMLAGICLLMSGMGRVPGNVLDGSGNLAARGGAVLLTGATVPARQEIVTETGINLALTDGSLITVAPKSQFRLVTPWIGKSTLYLSHGDVNLSVTKQTLGQTFSVQTPLGEIIVVGTRFRVNTIDDNALVYKQTAGNGDIRSYRARIKSVVVRVTEGVVKVRNAHDEVLVRAGYSAVLRDNQPRIELKPSSNEPSP